MGHGNEVAIFGEFVNDYQDGVISFGLRKAFYKVHAYDLPSLSGNI
jgi:hypothetical protein